MASEFLPLVHEKMDVGWLAVRETRVPAREL